MTSREAMLFMKYEHYGKCKGSFKDSQMKCKYYHIYRLYKKKRKHYIIFNNLRTFKDEHFKLRGDLDWHVPYQYVINLAKIDRSPFLKLRKRLAG